MTEYLRVYNKVEFTIDNEDAQFGEFGRDILELIKKYDGHLNGYLAENMTEDQIVCEDADCEEAERCIREVYSIS